MQLNPNVLAYYNLGLESERLRKHSLERVRTERILGRFLPPPPARVLDVGGGEGVYAFGLAEKGYEVELVDPVPLHVQQAEARQKQAAHRLSRIRIGDARKLEHESRSADAVLYLGPLYHLTEAADRSAALREAHRVLRPGGVLMAAYISRFASLIDGLLRGYVADDFFYKVIREDLKDGQHRNPTGNPAYFTDAYFHHPVEAAQELRDNGFPGAKLISVEGPFWTMPSIESTLNDAKLAARLLELAEIVESEETLIGVGGHFIACARKAEE